MKATISIHGRIIETTMSSPTISVSGTTDMTIKVYGAMGTPGVSGVYYGTDEPTDPSVNVWIDPSGASWETTMMNNVVQEVLSNIPAAEEASF